MNFSEIAEARYSCRSYQKDRQIESDKLAQILKSGRLSPSACNSQPYHVTVCAGESAKKVAKATTGVGINGFVCDAPVLLVISEKDYNKSAAMGAKIKKNDYRSIDIGILAAHLTLEAQAQGISSCILGWFDDLKIRSLCGLDQPVRLVIALGYASDGVEVRPKKRKNEEELFSYMMD